MVTDRNRFGRALRRLREDAGKTMGDMADHLEVSVAYISDMERGQKPPLTPIKLRSVCAFLGLPSKAQEELMALAAIARGVFELEVHHQSPKAREVGAALMRNWAELDNEQLEEIERVLKREGR